MPEGRTYQEYEDQRDDALRMLSIYNGKPYTVRFRAENPTLELFAHDKTSLIAAVKMLGRYSVVKARVVTFEGVANDMFGVNEQGIVFDMKCLPFDFDEVPYKAERGYFVGDTEDTYGGETSITESVEMEEDEVIALRRHMSLTR